MKLKIVEAFASSRVNSIFLKFESRLHVSLTANTLLNYFNHK